MKHTALRFLIASLLILVMALPLFACDKGNTPDETTLPADTTDTPAETPTEQPTETPTEEPTEEVTEPEAPLPTEITLPEAYTAADIVYECEDGSVVYSYNGKTAKDFEAVTAHYTSGGYKQYSSIIQGENPAATFVGDGPMAHIYWIKATGELSIAISADAAHTLPPMTPAATDGEYECNVAQMKDTQNFIGMGYVIQLKDGSFIVYDGSYANQTSTIVRYITNAWKGEGKPTVRAWVLTHSHNDHYPAFEEFANNKRFRDQITVEHVIVSPLNDERFALNDVEEFYFSTKLPEDVALLEGTKIVFAHTGMNFTFCNLQMEILYTPENTYKTATDVGNFNNTSIVTRLYAEGYSALFLGDVSNAGVSFMMQAYGDYLKSDMVQASHHGVEGSYILDLYDTVKAPIIFYPASLALYDQIQPQYSPEVHIALEQREYVKEILIHQISQFTRAWGTTFPADATLNMHGYNPPEIRYEGQNDIPESDRLTVNKRVFKVGEPIMITAVGDGYDWVGIFDKPNTISGAYRWWRLHDNDDEDYPVAPAGTPFDALTQPADRTNGEIPAGTWYIVLIDKDNGAVGVGSVTIAIVEDTPVADPLAPSIHVTFDGAAEDACGNTTVKTHGNAVYEEGVKGQGAVVGTDYFSIPGYDPDNKSFTISVWAKVKSITGDPALFATKEWASGSYKGFALGINGTSNLHANIGDGSHRVDIKPDLPSGVLNEWVHYTLVVDRMAGEMKVSINFGAFKTVSIPANLINAPYGGEGALFIGQDATGNYQHGKMTVTVDEFMVFDHALNSEDLSKLAESYGK